MSNKLEPIADAQLVTATGGMKWEDFRRSTNIEDRRTPADIQRDNAWWASQKDNKVTPTAPSVPTEAPRSTEPR